MPESGSAARATNACAVLDDAEFATLRDLARRYLASRSSFTRFMDTAGRHVEAGMSRLPAAWREQLHRRARDSLGMAYQTAILGLGGEPPPRERSRAPLYRLGTTLSGALTGAAGLPGVIADLPLSTLLILRSLADLARAEGHDLKDPNVQACCLEAFAFGGPTEEDDDADLAFWSSRAAVPVVTGLIPEIAGRLSARLALLLPARALPLLGGIAGAGINWHFSGFFQEMGRILLGLKRIEDAHDRAQVRSCFASVVRELREQPDGRVRPRGMAVRGERGVGAV